MDRPRLRINVTSGSESKELDYLRQPAERCNIAYVSMERIDDVQSSEPGIQRPTYVRRFVGRNVKECLNFV